MDWGLRNRISHIIKPNDSRALMLAVDHGYFLGPTEKLEIPRKTITPILKYCDSLMLTRGVQRTSVDPKYPVPIVLRVSGGSSIIGEDLSNEEITVSIKDAIRLNACGLAMSIFVGAKYEKQTIVNLGQLVSEAEEYGIPVLAVTAVGKEIGQKDARYLSLACRIAAEQGAHIVKTYYCENFEKVVESCPVPIIVAGGKKISKSLGNVITSQKWLRYGTTKTILLLLYKRITGARELGFEDIPALMDEYNELENIYFGKTKVDNEAKLVKSKGLYEYVNLLSPPKNSSTHVSYRLLIELCKIFKDNRLERIASKLIDYGTIKETNSNVEDLIKLAGNYSDDFEETKIPATEFAIDDSAKDALRQLADILSKDEKIEDLQNSIYSIAKENQVQPKDFFRILYQIILSTDRGPKIGPFIEDIGKKKVAESIKKYL